MVKNAGKACRLTPFSCMGVYMCAKPAHTPLIFVFSRLTTRSLPKTRLTTTKLPTRLNIGFVTQECSINN